MVHHRDVDAYLLAAKSFARFLAPRRIVVVADPTITEEDRLLIASHIPHVEFLRAEDFRDPGLPQGGCWERLTAISDLVTTEYVVQLDADTVTLVDLPEVRESVELGRSFVLGTVTGQVFVSCATAASWVRGRFPGDTHIQSVSESKLDALPEFEKLRYVRGCAGFSGFPPGSFDREKVLKFSGRMEQLIGDHWRSWGSEQVTSNFMVANASDAMVLPYPKYCEPLREDAGTVFLHFFGFVRFLTDRYAQLARRVIGELGA